MYKNKIIKLTKSSLCSQLYFKDDELGLYINVWDRSDIIETFKPSTCDAFIALIAGEVEIKNNDTSNIERVNTGESFIIPKGHNTRWHSLTQLLTFCVIYSPKTTETTSALSEYNQIIRINDHCINDHSINDQRNIPWQKTSDGFQKKIQYQSHNQKFTAGVWQGEDFKTGIINFPYNEFILVTHGCLACTDQQGVQHKISIGEALFVPQGVCCAWQVQGNISLQFVQIRP